MEEPRSTIQKRDAKGVVRHGAEWLVLWSDPDSVKTAEEKAADRRAQATRGEHERFLAAAVRSVARMPELQVAFRDGGGDDGACTLPPLPLEPAPADLDCARGRADALALTLRHHDPALHRTLAPPQPRARILFDRLEQARCEALGVLEMPGIHRNLTAALASRLEDLGLARAHLAAQIPLVEVLRPLALDMLLGRDQPFLASGGLEMWDGFARTRFGAELAALRPHLPDQRAYGRLAMAAIEAIYAAMEWDRSGPARTSPTAGVQPLLDPPAESGEPTRRIGDARVAVDLADLGFEPSADGDTVAMDEPERDCLPGPTAPAAAAAGWRYRIFSTAFDRTAAADELAAPGELVRLRHELDSRLGDIRQLLGRLANRLQRHLLAQQRTSWDFDQDEGMLDAARLDRVIVNPGTALSFKQERASPFRDTVLTLLIDCSGSMRGRPIALAAMAADIVARTLDRCGVACEVLGFTTAAWKGGESKRLWAAAGRPAEPGRLNDLLHIVYKSGDSPYRRARTSLGLMLKDGLLKENIDGEALAWAARRLNGRRESRKLMVVVSDGAAVDQATLEANADPLYLDRHLRAVIAQIEAAGRIELSAIGIRHDLGRHYARAVTIDDADALGPTLLARMEELFRPRTPGSPGCRAASPSVSHFSSR